MAPPPHDGECNTMQNREAGHLSDVTLVTEAAYLQDGKDSESILEKKKRLIEFPVHDHARSPPTPTPLHGGCRRRAKNPVRLSCTSLPRILASSFPPNFLSQESNGTD